MVLNQARNLFELVQHSELTTQPPHHDFLSLFSSSSLWSNLNWYFAKVSMTCKSFVLSSKMGASYKLIV